LQLIERGFLQKAPLHLKFLLITTLWVEWRVVKLTGEVVMPCEAGYSPLAFDT